MIFKWAKNQALPPSTFEFWRCNGEKDLYWLERCPSRFFQLLLRWLELYSLTSILFSLWLWVIAKSCVLVRCNCYDAKTEQNFREDWGKCYLFYNGWRKKDQTFVNLYFRHTKPLQSVKVNRVYSCLYPLMRVRIMTLLCLRKQSRYAAHQHINRLPDWILNLEKQGMWAGGLLSIDVARAVGRIKPLYSFTNLFP